MSVLFLVFHQVVLRFRYGLFYDENEDPMDALKAATQPKEPAKVKATETKPQAGKPAEVRGKVGAGNAPQTSAGVKKTAGPKEAPTAGQRSNADQNKPREGKLVILWYIIWLNALVMINTFSERLALIES